MSDVQDALKSVGEAAESGGSSIAEALRSAGGGQPPDVETAKASLKDIFKPAPGTTPGTFEHYKLMGREAFLEANPLVNLGAWAIKKVTGQRTEGSGAGLGPELKQKDPTFSESLSEGVKFFKERPLTATAELAKGMLYSPELAAISLAKGPQVLGRMAEMAQAGKKVRAIAATGDVALQGGVAMGGAQALQQVAQTEEGVKWGPVAAQAAMGAGGVVLLKGAGRAWDAIGKAGEPKAGDATPTLDRFQETVESGGKLKSHAEDTYRQPSPVAETDAALNARKTANDLMQRGASTKEVERAIKRNPQVGTEMEKLRGARGTAKESFTRAVQGEVLPTEPPIQEAAFRNRQTGEILSSGARHDLRLKGDPNLEQGFKTTEGEFVNRRQAAQRMLKESPESLAKQPGAEGLHSTDFKRGGIPGQSGQADPKLLAALGLGVGGVLAGAYLAGDDRVAGAVLGGVGAIGLARLPKVLSGLKGTLSYKQALGNATRIGLVIGTGTYLGSKSGDPVAGAAIASAVLLGVKALPKARALGSDDLIAARNGNVAAQERITANLKRDITTAIPDSARRVAIAEALDRGSSAGLSPDEVKVFGAVRNFFNDLGKEALDAGVIKGMRENYISYIVERDPSMSPEQQRGIIDRMFKVSDSADPSSARSRFGRQGKYESFSEINNALKGSGLKLKTQDVGEIMEIYSKSMRRAIENKILIDNLKGAKTPEGIDMLVKQDKVGNLPQGYIRMGHSQLQGYGVHPELVDSMKVVFGSQDHNVVTRGLLGLSMAVKRMNVFGSAFHAKSLMEVYINAMGKDVYTKGMSPVNDALKMFREGGLGDTMDLGIRRGLMMKVPHDISQTIITDIGKVIDGLVPRTTGLTIKPAEAVTSKIDYVNKKLDALTWDYLHAGIKGAIFLKEFETMMLRNAEAHAKDAKVLLKSREQIAAEVAKYSNDLTGGLDWFRVATDAKTQVGRSLGMFFAGSQGRALAQILAFAPDWAVSTLRAGFKSFGQSDAGLKGILRPENTTDLYRKYAFRSTVYWITLLNGMNLAFSGKPIWQNKDPTRIDMGDGTTVQAGKHTFESVHAVTDPARFAYNKLGFTPKMVLDFFSGKEGYGEKAPKYSSFPGHAARAALPFAAGSAAAPGLSGGERVKRAVVSSAGLPQYGYTPEQKTAAKQQRAEEKRAKRRRELGLED
jgi:hypothetical protein